MCLVRLFCLSLVVAFAIASPWTPVPRPDTWWQDRHNSLVQFTESHAPQIEVVFLGDSFIQNWSVNGNVTWDTYYALRNSSNYGISGDRTENIIWRIENGEFDKLTPKLVVLMIGYNNIWEDPLPAGIAKGVKTIVQKLQEKMPKTKILLLSVLPIKSVHLDSKVHKVNQLISQFANNKVVFYHDLTSAYETALGKLVDNQFDADHLHLSKLGYQIWYNQTEETFVKLLK